MLEWWDVWVRKEKEENTFYEWSEGGTDTTRALIYQPCVRTDLCVMNAYEHSQAKYGIYQLVLVLRNVRKFKHSSDHAYTQNLVVEQWNYK